MDYHPISEEQIRSAKSFWEPKYGRELSEEVFSEIIRSTESFIDVFWEEAEMDRRINGPTSHASSANQLLEPVPGTSEQR
jgi:hypothetical protein